jgi:hypothetical protein
MAQPIVVTAVTTESCAALGPSEDHDIGHTAEKAALSSNAEARSLLI